MRLFVAVLFEKPIVDALCTAGEELCGQAHSGDFTRWENLHMTMAFLGETENLTGATRALDAVQAAPFPLLLRGMGRFWNNGDTLYWMGAEKTAGLLAAQGQICRQLRAEGFVLEERAFAPHVTLGRRVRMRDGFDPQHFAESIPPLYMQVRRISLMRSEHVHGALTYTEL